MRNIKMIIQYDGSNFKGFQRLKDNDNTIQGKIEDVLSKMTEEKIEIIASVLFSDGRCPCTACRPWYLFRF